jgi:phosphoribosylaminoimidazolecarboxamide formyltransferase/IMP cyclohydrolase
VTEKTLRELAVAVYALTSGYDGMITKYLLGAGKEEELPETLDLSYKKLIPLRYGENPHQKAAFYREASGPLRGIAAAKQIQGKELSFNNIMDLSSALEIVKEFDLPAACVVKHNNPCGAATADTLEKAYLDALDSDRQSAFGGIMGFNKVITKSMAEIIIKEADFVECMIAPGYEKGALEVLSAKKNVRVLELADLKWDRSGDKDFKKIPGGLLVQDSDIKELDAASIKVVTSKKPSDDLMASLLFAWKLVKHVKSNAIAQGTKTVGIGAGQMSRVDSVVIASAKAGSRTRGAVLASDAFFPKPDSIEEAHKAGISAIIQPGGSIKDQDVIAACDKFGIPMVFTGMRHFRH